MESIDFDKETIQQGDIISMRVLVRNQGQADATMVSVRCQTDDQLIGVETVAIIKPGELQSVSCDWQVPLDVRVVRFSAVVDRGLEIQEGDENNNVLEELVAIEEVVDDTSDETAGLLNRTDGMVCRHRYRTGRARPHWFLMPPKIKKIE